MIFPDVSIEDWCKKYPGLKIKTTNCKHCTGIITINIPYICQDYAGFIAFKCPHCNGDHRCHVGLPISKKEIDAWNKAFSGLDS